MIIASTPYRISLFGGATDYPSWFEKYQGKTLSFTINKYCHVSFRKLPKFFWHKYRIVYSKTELCNKISEIKHPTVRNVLKYFKIKDGIEIHHFSDLPARSGIGSSSAFTVSLINSISQYYKMKLSKKKIVETAIFVEQRMNKEFVGNQDQIITAYGGFNKIIFKKNFFSITKINLKNLDQIKKNSILLYTGKSRIADKISESKVKNIRKEKSINALKQIYSICNEAEKLIFSKKIDLKKLGKLLNISWENKKKLSRKVSNNFINQHMKIIKKNNSYGAKVLGAGGGGFIFVLAHKKFHKKIINETGLLKVDFDFDKKGTNFRKV
jgi:D-glycero-alpha-D-manno-heptose-7-phosphate kinase